MDWLEQHDEALPIWIRHTKVPMLATLPGGKILWANESFERLLDYSLAELMRLTWTSLTAAEADAANDSEMAEILVAGTGGRISYEFRKAYRKKNGDLVPVVIDVMRFPLHGGEEQFEAFLVSVMPIESSAAFAIAEVHQLRKELFEWMDNKQGKPLFSEKLWNWATSNPVKAGTAIAFFCFLLFGDRVLEILREIRTLFGGGDG